MGKTANRPFLLQLMLFLVTICTGGPLFSARTQCDKLYGLMVECCVREREARLGPRVDETSVVAEGTALG